MKRKSGPSIHLEKVPHRSGDKTYYSWLLRTSFREDGKVKHRTLANLSELPEESLEVLRSSLRGETMVSLSKALKITSSRSHGAVHAVLTTIRRLGLDRMLLSRDLPWRRLALAMIVARVLRPKSKLFTSSWWSNTTLPEELDLPREAQGPNPLYEAMDELLAQQEKIQDSLAEKHLQEGALVLYDLSSTYLEGDKCPLAAFGHNRDGKKGKRQFNYGLLTNLEGCPIAIEVFPGNTSDPLTLGSQIQRLREKFHLQRVVMVGDRGMIASKRIPDIEQAGYGWITALKAKDIQRLDQQGAIQLTLFDERDLFEITDPERPGERLVVCRNPLVAEERRRKRRELLDETEEALKKIKERVEKGRLKEASAIGLAVGRFINRWKMAKHFTLEITDGHFNYHRKLDSIEKEAKLDGLYVIRSNVPVNEMKSEQLVESYKSLQRVEQAFRSMKTTELDMRPVYHRLEDRVRAHAFLVMLAYYVLWHLRQALKPILDDPKERVSLRLLLDRLAAVQKNQVELNGVPFDVVTTPNEEQVKILDLLGVKLSV